MNTIQLAAPDVCTGCGACAFRCPKHCIKMHENEIGIVLPVIETSECIKCHSCEKVCPALHPVEFNQPLKSYAAWSVNKEERRTSASGGIAAELYKQAIKDGFVAVGASQNDDFTVTHKIAESVRELAPFKNSKYVFSDAYKAFPQIRRFMKGGRSVVFIGLPCQVAALKKLFPINDDSLLLVDVVCHGVTPFSYLRQHIDCISRQSGKKTVRMSFRDPEAYTYTFTFTLYGEDGTCFYSKADGEGDTYQDGYHRMVSYRENCYHCPYARKKRVSDLTLSDYKGLGRMATCDFTEREVSCILINTQKGGRAVRKLIEHGSIKAFERPLEEPIKGDPQLRRPSKKSRMRICFEKSITIYGGDFEKSMSHAVTQAYKWRHYDQFVNLFKRIVRKMKRLYENRNYNCP